MLTNEAHRMTLRLGGLQDDDNLRRFLANGAKKRMRKRPMYFGVIGNRDHIKIGGRKVPYWEFLDSQPDGWLSSLVYKRDDLPPGVHPFIFDCGAWSYRKDSKPKYTPAQALELYDAHAPAHALVVCPDHMLIDGTDLDARREINRRNAQEWIRIVPPRFEPMAVIHGMTTEERCEHAQELVGLGYSHISIGGVAARAAKKREVIETVRAIREAVPKVYLHVLGLSSPDYMRSWQDIGVNSCDGSSHFKQAFAGGAFFAREGRRLVKHQAARPGEPITAPWCDCRACWILRGNGIDTRSYGSNEHNMGRAVHNQNMLMAAQRAALRRKVGLVSCSAQKREGRHKAKDLYTSPLFRKSREWVERNCDEWYILSAKHRLLPPDQVIDAYDVSLHDMSSADLEQWNWIVSIQLHQFLEDDLIVLAGRKYTGWASGFSAAMPLEGLGIGERLAWFDEQKQDIIQGMLF